ncbi:unnamed protein product [Ectocarpus sp. CCAP 1310/34]|nr:unnamed protein product [Ectocarpus sp. CCAP 1310/34]
MPSTPMRCRYPTKPLWPALHTQFTSTIMDDMDDVAAFWQHHAEGFCPQGNPLKVWEELLLIAAQTPERFR